MNLSFILYLYLNGFVGFGKIAAEPLSGGIGKFLLAPLHWQRIRPSFL